MVRHVAGFSDPMVDCRETKRRYRADHIQVLRSADAAAPMFAYQEGEPEPALKRAKKVLGRTVESSDFETVALVDVPPQDWTRVYGPDAKKKE